MLLTQMQINIHEAATKSIHNVLVLFVCSTLPWIYTTLDLMIKQWLVTLSQYEYLLYFFGF